MRAAVAGRDADARELVPALVVGDDGGLDPDLADDFRTTGLTHLLAVSGTNLTLVVGFLLVLGRWAGVRGTWLYALGVLGICGFVLTARAEPSVVRAAAMGAVALVGMGRNGRSRGVRGLGVAVLGLLLVWPRLAVTAGFALSALATAGILLLAPVWRDALMRWTPRWVAEAVSVPLAAQVACTPRGRGDLGPGQPRRGGRQPAGRTGRRTGDRARALRRAARPAVEPARRRGRGPGGVVGGLDHRGRPLGRGRPDGGGRLGHRTGAARAAHGAVPARGAPRPAAARPSGHDAGLHRPPRRGDAGPAPDPGLAAARLGAGDVRRRPGRRARPARRCRVGGGRRRRTRARTDRRLPRPPRGHRRAAPRAHALPRRPRRRGGGCAGRSRGGGGRGHGAARPARGRRRRGARGRPRPGPGGVRPHAAGRRGDAADGVAASRVPARATPRRARPTTPASSSSPRWAGCGSC